MRACHDHETFRANCVPCIDGQRKRELRFRDKSAWVIESRRVAPPEYWSGGRSGPWSTNHLDAIRFSRRQDAERVMVYSGLVEAVSGLFAAEHVWAGPGSETDGRDAIASQIVEVLSERSRLRGAALETIYRITHDHEARKIALDALHPEAQS